MMLKTQHVRMKKRGSFVEATGRVTNDSDQPVQDVRAVVSYFDRDGDMIQMDAAKVRNSVLMPGQTTSFRVICLWNPQMVRSRVQINASPQPAAA
jgi:hypothetical protein